MLKINPLQMIKTEYSIYDFSVRKIDISNDTFILIYEDPQGFREIVVKGIAAAEEILSTQPTRNVFNQTRQNWARIIIC